ncbi:MAG: hypothetical protein ACOYNF_18015, partial [Rhodoferax sp.]
MSINFAEPANKTVPIQAFGLCAIWRSLSPPAALQRLLAYRHQGAQFLTLRHPEIIPEKRQFTRHPDTIQPEMTM